MAVSDQMEMALSESERQDPVSGNDVPMGSLPEEVRDDVPAMLSEGEYVVPADVLRFYGLKFFEDLRTDAKVQIAQMADEGRIGGEPIAGPGSAAPTPDQPNGLDLSPEDMQKLESVLQASEGGAVGFQEGGLSDVLKENEEGGLPTKKVGMDVDKDTDMLIDRIMNSVQKNPMIKEKLAARGIGFMNGGDVKGYAPGGAVDYINVAKNYKPSFDPFDPDFGLGMYSSGLMKPKTAADIQEEAGVAAPTEEVKKKKVEPGGPDKETQGPTFDTMSDKDILAFSSLLSKISPKLAKNWPGLAKAQAKAMKGVKADIKSMVEGEGIGGGMGGGSTSGGSMGADSNQAGAGYGASQTSAQGGTGLGYGGGLSVGEAGRGGSSSSSSSGQSEADAEAEAAGEGFGLNKGAFISRRKKT
jgi:hypothetical protein